MTRRGGSQTMVVSARGRKAMRRLFVSLIITLLAIGAGSSPALAGDSSTHYYLAMGDSLAVGFQPNDPSPNHQDTGYVALLHTALAATDPKLELENVSCGGETTVSMIDGSQPLDVALSCG